MRYDVIVIGGGLGGLECAYILSRSGRSVLLLEQGAQLGGCMQSYCRRGLKFDTGFHYVGGLAEGQALHRVFRYLGLLDLPWWRLDDCFDRVVIGGHSFPFRQGFGPFVQALAECFPGERKALASYGALLERTGAERFRAFSSSATEDASSLRLWETGAYSYLKDTFSDPLLVEVLAGSSLKMELRRESLPLFTFLHGNAGFVESSWRLKGSGALIVRALADGIRAFGGETVCGARVQELVERDGRVLQAVCSDGRTYEGKVFVSDVHPALTYGWVRQSDRLKNAFRRRIAALENTSGMCTVSLLLKPGTFAYLNYNLYVYRGPAVWTSASADGVVDRVMVSCRVPEDGGHYARQIDLLTPMSWESCRKWAATTAGMRGEDYVRLKERMAAQCLALAEEVLTGLGSCVAEYYVSTPLTYRDYLAAPEGTAYGVRKDFREPLMTVLPVCTPIPNLLLTGQSLVMHGLEGVTMTALATCAEILGKDEIGNIIES